MSRLSRRILVSALTGDSVGTKIQTSASVGGLSVPQQYVEAIFLRCLGGVAIDWRGPQLGGLVQAKVTMPAGEVGVVEGVSLPQDVELFLPAGVTAPTEVQVMLDYQGQVA